MREQGRHTDKEQRVPPPISALSELRVNDAKGTIGVPRVSLVEAEIVELIRIADIAKRLRCYSRSNLIFAYLAHTLGEELSGKLFLEERQQQGTRPEGHPRYMDLYSIQVPGQKAYLCIPYPILKPNIAKCFETLAQSAPPVIHQRKFLGTTYEEISHYQKDLNERFFGYFSDSEKQSNLVLAAITMLDVEHRRLCLQSLYIRSRYFFGKNAPPAFQGLRYHRLHRSY
jgi:hypothetical protein